MTKLLEKLLPFSFAESRLLKAESLNMYTKQIEAKKKTRMKISPNEGYLGGHNFYSNLLNESSL